MLRSESIKELTPALVKFQGSLEALKTNSIAKTEKYSFKYADLAVVWDTIRKPLTDNGFAVIQDPTVETIPAAVPTGIPTTKVKIVTLLAHISGEWISSELVLSAEANTPQKIGSAISYGRRYSLLSMLGLASEDDDGNAASGTKEARPTSQPPTQKAPAPQGSPAAKAPTTPPPAGETPAQARQRKAKEDAGLTTKPASTPAPTPATPPADGQAHRTPDQMRAEIDKLALEMGFGDPIVASEFIESATRYTQKKPDGTEIDWPGRKNSKDISEKGVPVAIRKIEKMYKDFLTVQENAAKEEAATGTDE
jgi:hypothetical protein